jgi:hypothetical protein
LAEEASRGNSDVAASSVGTAARAEAETSWVAMSNLARTLEGNKAHGRRGRQQAGNGVQSLRTHPQSKASRSRVVGTQQEQS